MKVIPPVLIVLLALPLEGQSLLSFPLPPGTPAPASAHEQPFSDGNALAYRSVNGLIVIHGLAALGALSVQTIPFPSGAVPAGPWLPLSASRALYRAQSGLLVLITGLPATPSFTVTSLSLPTANLLAANETTLVHADGMTMTLGVVRVDQGSASYTVLPPPYPVIIGTIWSPNRPGRVDADTVATMDTGLDGVLGTADDAFLLVQGLAGPPSGFVLSRIPFPAGSQARGYGVSQGGTPFFWGPATLAGAGAALEVPVSFLRNPGSAPSSFVSFTVAPQGVLSLPPPPYLYQVLPGIEDTVLVQVFDDSAMGYVSAFVADVDSTAPFIVGSYHQSDVASGRQMGPREYLVHAAAMAPSTVPQPCTAFRRPFWGSLLESVSFLTPTEPRESVLLNPDTLVFCCSPNSSGASSYAVVPDLWGSATSLVLPSSSGSAQLPTALASGKVAALHVDPSGALVLSLEIVASPAWFAIPATGAIPSWNPVQITCWPPVPRLGSPFLLQFFHFAYSPVTSTVWTGIATAIRPQNSPLPSWIGIDPDTLQILFPVSMIAGWASLAFPALPPSLPAAVLGAPFYLQAVVPTASSIDASAVYLVTFG